MWEKAHDMSVDEAAIVKAPGVKMHVWLRVIVVNCLIMLKYQNTVTLLTCDDKSLKMHNGYGKLLGQF